jgi:AcrR family transcriptional regulator
MNPPRGDAESRRAEILDAALQVFGQYGYRRTSMDDVAREADIAKGTIYLSFTSKEEVFQALSERLSQRMLAGAEAELLDAKHRLAGDLVADAASRYKRLVRDVLTDAAVAGELDLEPVGLTADTAAELLIASARGLESSAASPAAYRRYLDALVRVMVAGLSGTHSRAACPGG